MNPEWDDLTIRVVTPDDIEAVRQIHNDSRVRRHNHDWLEMSKDLQRLIWRGTFQSGGRSKFVILLGGEIVGMTGFREGDGDAHFGMFLKPRLRRPGLAKATLDLVAAEAYWGGYQYGFLAPPREHRIMRLVFRREGLTPYPWINPYGQFSLRVDFRLGCDGLVGQVERRGADPAPALTISDESVILAAGMEG